MSEHDEPKIGNPDNPGDERDLVWRTRVKCDGHGCDFYAEGRFYWRVVEQHDAHLADVLLAEGYTTTPAPETVETVEWGVRWSPEHDIAPEPFPSRALRAHRQPTTARAYKRTRTSYADSVTEWVPVDRGADGHEEGEQ